MIKDYIESNWDLEALEDEEMLQEVVKDASETFEQPIDVHYVGDYDSPGYTVNYYVITWVDNGKAEVLPASIVWC